MNLLWQEIKRHKKVVFLALGLATINQVFSLLDPLIFRSIIDNYATRASEFEASEFIRGVGSLLLLSVGAAFISRTAKAFQNYYVNVITQRSGTNLYSQSVSHAFSLPYAVFEDQRSGEVLLKMQKARSDSQLFISNVVNILFLSLVSVVFVIVYAFFVSWIIGLTFVLTLPTLGLAVFFLSKKIKEAQQAIVAETASLSGSTTETIRNVELVKSLGLEEQEVLRLNNVNEKILDLELKKVRMVRKLDFIQGTLMNGINSGILLLNLWLIFTQAITLGQFFSLWFYSFWLFQPLYMVGTLATSYQETQASLKQLNDFLEQKPSLVPPNVKDIGVIKKIEYRNTSLRYGNNEDDYKHAVSGVNVTIQSGETVAFVGPSGSGKSSMIKLLAGLYDPTDGQVLVNDTDIKDINIGDLRRRMGLVAQETQLFAGTIRENLHFVRPDAGDEEMLKALESAQAKVILQKSPAGSKGLDTRIGEGGLKLSGGEKQRLAIARALLRKPDVIVFDEATSSLDSITEKAITDTIKKIEHSEGNLIKVLVAHRLSTVIHADRIYVFEKGKTAEVGTHEELIGRGGLYSALWRQQIAAEG
jgi:ATP-binding cassette subfamily B protein